MIWRLAHPVRGLVAAVLVFAVGALLLRFGMGLPELLVLVLLSGIAFVLASREYSA